MALTQAFQLEALLEKLVAIDSVNPGLVPGGAGETEIAAFVAEWLERAGLEVEIEDLGDCRANVVGRAPGSGGGRTLMLNAHLDTVGVAGMERPHQPEVREGRLYGRGACDTKGALAAFMAAAAEIRQHRLRGDLVLAAVADEEFESAGTEALVRRCRAEAAIVGEPTNLRITTAHKGFIWLDIETSGVAAHGSDFKTGIDAITKMGKVLVGLEALDASLRRAQPHPLLGWGSLHASLIEGGQELSSYPERCVLRVERRTLPGESQKLVEDEIQSLLNSLARSDHSFSGSLRTTFVRHPMQIASDHPLVELLYSRASSTLQRKPELIGSAFWTDAALLNDAGIPSVVFGPTGEGLHGAVEWVEIESVRRCFEIVLAAGLEFCA